MTQLVSAARFKALARRKIATGVPLGIRKDSVSVIAPPDAERRALRFCISTAGVDRENDTVAVAGWDLDAYLRNPVVLWGHDASRLPIGRAFDLAIEGDALMASVEFIPDDTPEAGPFADAVYRLAKLGFIAATSVGFRPIKWAYTNDPARGADDWFPGIDFEQQELVEWSIVTVPANPDALIEQPGPGEGTAIASDTPPTTGEEVTAFNEEQARARARLRRMLQLAVARDDAHIVPVPDVPHKHAGARRRA